MIDDFRNRYRLVRQRYRYELLLILPTIGLVGFGLIMIYSASYPIAEAKKLPEAIYAFKQVIFLVIGFCGLFCAYKAPVALSPKVIYTLLIVSILMLIAVKFTPLGFAAGGAKRWFRLGPLSFQPSEFARIVLIMFLAYSLSRKAERVRECLIGFLPHALILGVFAGLIAIEPDFGSTLILVMLVWAMLFFAGIPLIHLLIPAIPLVPGLVLYLVSKPYRMQRLWAYLDPWAYASSWGYQPIHSQMAFGTGGLTGSGLGESILKLYYLPEPHTDFIISIIGEEFGFIGVTAVVACYVIILVTGISIAVNAKTLRASLLATGLVLSLTIQIFFNLGVALCLLPTKGLPLPLLSYGGSSLIFSMISIGILMAIARETTRC
ncbi:putative lipid II flippase FtsW [Desulfatirhabdium butyrativorans]|uniref:putative lipid II flippase FtsW n=1 Tax=Desulfatirhabdium butyrativorans TaxID=340467 RepID=UPI00040F576B|nr:putative lipid II flippase FtsW [Desulfatirhabdium butyrativorans]